MSSSDRKMYPPLWRRLYSVWFRHMRVYTKNLASNGLPPFLEPLIFLAGVGLGLSNYITESIDGLEYIEFLGMGLLVTTAMFTSAYECSFGTFIRLEFHKVYDGMLAAPVTAENLIVGEMLWAASKGFFFSLSTLIMLSLFKIVSFGDGYLAPFIGFLTALMFASLSLLITSFVKTINHFNFYFTGFISPMFFFSGVVFPISKLPAKLQPFAEAVPLTHSVRLVRAVCTGNYRWALGLDLLYIFVFIAVVGFLAVHRLKKRLVY